ncbi:MAG: hypothetical protein NC827_09840, partial [Candidatus Omnitrophica bacterium]|nr:hypothetical protein [Candidatus Omnitrophota bacterium]
MNYQVVPNYNLKKILLFLIIFLSFIVLVPHVSACLFNSDCGERERCCGFTCIGCSETNWACWWPIICCGETKCCKDTGACTCSGCAYYCFCCPNHCSTEDCSRVDPYSPIWCVKECGSDSACDDKQPGDVCGYGAWEDDSANFCKERREIKKCSSECSCVGSGTYEYRNKATCTSCTGSPYCSGTERCGTSGGDTRYYNFHCSAGSCVAQSSESCKCDATDSDGGKNYITQGTC